MTGSTVSSPASASSSLEKKQKEAWLRAREEKRQAQIVTVNQGLSLTPSLYFGTRRCTYSTVVSVVTTVKPVPRFDPSDSSAQPVTTATSTNVQPQAKAEACWLEEHEQDNQDEDQGLRSPYAGLRTGPSQQHQSLALRIEQRMFMQSLQAARRARARQEHEAALVIQRVRRGFVLRRNFRALKQKLLVRKRIRGSLLQVTKGTAIVLGEKDRRARVLAVQRAAASRIQGAFRGWCARRLRAKLRALRRHERLAHAASVLQRAWRACLARWLVTKLRFQRHQARRQALARLLARLFAGFKARHRVRALRLQRQARAAVTLQSFVRRRLLAAKTVTLARARRVFERHHDGAIRLQSLIRGVLQRARVLRLRRDEQRAVLVACALALQRVARGFLGRQRARRRGIERAHERGWACALHVTRLARGFLARLEAARERDVQEGDLLVQARRGNVDAVVDLLDGFDPLAGELEAGEGDEDDLLSVEPADVSVVSPDSGNGVLHLAAKFGHLEVVTLLLPRLMDATPDLVYARNFAGLTPLALAVLGGHERVAVYLLTMTSSLFVDRVRPGRRRTLLHETARRGLVTVVAKLLQLFPQLFSGGERDAWTQRTALHEALLVGVEVVEDETAQPWTRHHAHAHLNAQSGVDAEEEAANAMAVLETVLAKAPQAPLDAQDFLGFTALHVAAARGNLRAVTRLLAFGADVGVHDAQGRTAWRVALLCGHEACFQEIRRKWLHDVVNNNNNASQRAGSASITAAAPASGGVNTPTTPSTPNTTSSSRAVVNPAAALSRSPALHPQLGRELFAACEAGDVAKMRFFIDECDVSVNTVEEEVEVVRLDSTRASGELQEPSENTIKDGGAGDGDTGDAGAATDSELTQESQLVQDEPVAALAPQRTGGRSLLMVACELQDARAVAFLLGRRDLDLTFTTRDGRSALSVAQAQSAAASSSPLSASAHE